MTGEELVKRAREPMTTPIDELAGIEPLSDEEIGLLRQRIGRLRAAKLPLAPGDVLDARVLATLDAARSTPVPASNVSEGLREAIDAVADALNDLDLYGGGSEHPNLHRHWGIIRRAALAHAAPERLDERLLVKAIEGGLASVDDEWTVGELAELSAAEYARLVRPELGASRDRPIIQPDATEEAELTVEQRNARGALAADDFEGDR